MELDYKEVILDLLFQYESSRSKEPTMFEVMAIENAVELVKDRMEPSVYQSYVEWIERNKAEDELFETIL